MLWAINYYLTVVILTTALLYIYAIRNFNYWKNKEIGYVRPTPFFGNFFGVIALKQHFGSFLEGLYNKTDAPLLGFFIFDRPCLLIRDLDVIKDCMIKKFNAFADRNVIVNRKIDEMGADVLFVLKNPMWKEMRAQFAPMFSTRKMKNFLLLMNKASTDLTNYIKMVAIDSNYVDAREMCLKYTTDVISSCTLGVEARCFQNEKAEMRELSRRAFTWSFSRKVQIAMFHFAPIVANLLRLKFIDADATYSFANVLNQVIADRKLLKVQKEDLVEMIINFENHHSGNIDLSRKNMFRAQVLQFFMAGFESTGSTISYLLYELSLFPSIQDHIRKEITTVLRKYGDVTYEAVQEMYYLDMAIKETLRKYPVLPFVDRCCNTPYAIPKTNISIDKDTPIYVSIFGLHRNPQYFPDPERFDPERFNSENKCKRPAYCYMPFGTGPRNCIGGRFGMLGVKIGIIHILKDFSVELPAHTPLSLEFDPTAILLTPKGDKIDLRFKIVSSV